MAELDLDALAVEPLAVKLGGQTYMLVITVKGMMAIDKARRENAEQDTWPMMQAMAEAAGLPAEVFENLSADQATKLVEELTSRFFGEAARAAAKETAGASPGAMPSPSSSTPTPDSISPGS